MTLKPYKIFFLVPIFEKEESVEDLIQNIKSLCPNSGIVFHIDQSCSDEFCAKIHTLEEYYPFCFILPERYDTHWGSGLLMEVFCEMINFIDKFDYQYMYITASNSLIINPKLEEIVDTADIFYGNPWMFRGGWVKDALEKDSSILKYIENKHTNVFVHICEGMCLCKKFANELYKEIRPYLNYEVVSYPREEYLLPTAFNQLDKSDYRRVDRNLEKWVWVRDNNIDKYALSVATPKEYAFDILLNSQYDILSQMWVYSLKRIDRNYEDYHRRMIREHFCYNNQVFL